MHLSVALLPQVPEPLVMHFLVLGSGDEARGGLCLVDRSVAMDPGPTRLRLGPRIGWRPKRLRRAFRVIEATAVAQDRVGIVLGPRLGMRRPAAIADLLACGAHALAPFRISATWINFIGTPMRSAHPC